MKIVRILLRSRVKRRGKENLLRSNLYQDLRARDSHCFSTSSFWSFHSGLCSQWCRPIAVWWEAHRQTNSTNARLPSGLRGHARSAHGHMVIHAYHEGNSGCPKWKTQKLNWLNECLKTRLDAGCAPWYDIIPVSIELGKIWQCHMCPSILYSTKQEKPYPKHPPRVFIRYCHRLGHWLGCVWGGYVIAGICRRLVLALMILIAFLRKHWQLCFVIRVSLRLGNLVLHHLLESKCGGGLFSFPSLERLS